ncbi:PUA-like domain-containing protein [Mycena olivaceomarginata]|nr:PUA-like domain-containing protein [Mycena olivaceomarginata]
MVSDYEKQRLLNMERNKALLREMGRRRLQKSVHLSKKHESAPSPKASRTESVKSRNSEVGEASAQIFGSIPGVEVGTWWESREACSTDSIHAPWVAGIAPGPQGAYSVALSGGYPDDVDWGYAFTYTGSGGRNLKGTTANPMNLRTAPQSSDQTFDITFALTGPGQFNKALKASSEKKKPVRVIRGFKLDSPYAPYEGYRYDGLYRRKGWRAISFANSHSSNFQRLPSQPSLPRRADDASEEAATSKEAQEDMGPCR